MTKTKEPEPEAISTFEKDPRWPSVLEFNDIKPGDNCAVMKTIRQHGRSEAALREAGSGPDLMQQLQQDRYAVEEVDRQYQRWRGAGLKPPMISWPSSRRERTRRRKRRPLSQRGRS